MDRMFKIIKAAKKTLKRSDVKRPNAINNIPANMLSL